MLTSSKPIAFDSYERSIKQAVYILVYSRYKLRAENLDSRFLWKILKERERENKNREKNDEIFIQSMYVVPVWY